MSKYSALDAHSRSCPSCIRQRELDLPIDHGGHSKDKKKTSLPCEKRKISGSRSSLVKRSNSSLSFSSDVGVLKKEDTFDGSTYLTPTQRKNQEIKRIRLELAKANELLQSRDKELVLLRREVSALKESGQMNESWTAETGSVTDSGNCEESCSTSWDPDQEIEGCTEQGGHKLENIDFELMETALKEEEETRHKLEAGNEELRDELIDVRRELAFTRDQYEEEVSEMKKNHEDDMLEMKKENNNKIEELVNELAGSSLRCARQQDAIEHKQNRLDDLLRELTIYKENLTKAEKNLQVNEETLAKVKADIDEQPKYLNLVTNTAVHHSHSQTDPKDEKGTGCQTEQIMDPLLTSETNFAEQTTDDLHGAEADLMYPKSKEESTCDNKIHYTYQFLKRSIYYFITDKENSAYHLKSIQRLLEFSDLERNAISKIKPAVEKY